MTKKYQILADAEYRRNNRISTSTHALGDGEWSIEVHDSEGFLFELVGEESTDLWGIYQEIQEKAKAYALFKGWYVEPQRSPAAAHGRRRRS